MTVKELSDALSLFRDEMEVKVSCDKYVRNITKVTTITDMDTNMTSVDIIAEDKPSLAALIDVVTR